MLQPFHYEISHPLIGEKVPKFFIKDLIRMINSVKLKIISNIFNCSSRNLSHEAFTPVVTVECNTLVIFRSSKSMPFGDFGENRFPNNTTEARTIRSTWRKARMEKTEFGKRKRRRREETKRSLQEVQGCKAAHVVQMSENRMFVLPQARTYYKSVP